MYRRLATSGVAIALLAATTAVMWSGLAWPPPLWIVEYGCPGDQGATRRTAVIDGVEFVEVPVGYYRVSEVGGIGLEPDRRSLGERLRTGAFTGSFSRGSGGVMVHSSTIYLDTYPAWKEIPRPVWIAVGWEPGSDLLGAGRIPGVALRIPTWDEQQAAGRLATSGEWWFAPWEGMNRSELPPPSFTLGPGQEHLVEPYLVEGP